VLEYSSRRASVNVGPSVLSGLNGRIALTTRIANPEAW
jgi:hypothetical protein